MIIRYQVQRRIIGTDYRTFPSRTMHRFRVLDTVGNRPVRWCLTLEVALAVVARYEAEDRLRAFLAAVSATYDRAAALITRAAELVDRSAASTRKRSNYTLAGD